MKKKELRHRLNRLQSELEHLTNDHEQLKETYDRIKYRAQVLLETQQILSTIFNKLSPMHQALFWNFAIQTNGDVVNLGVFKRWKESLSYAKYECLREFTYQYIFAVKRSEQKNSNSSNDS
jgi:predicted nuclease with TOPRIM domain